uniref:PD-(D/E)XK endonuclease-like domain-containing protein n=1 Tax=Streptomyces phage Geonosis TaxID=3158856 RepID=A0AAU7GWD3_9CAUD
MARRLDTGWRDGLLNVRHAYWGHESPAVGMKFPMIEYDRGEPLAVISYQRRGEQLPVGKEVASAYFAFGRLMRWDGLQLPFFTVQYDARNWSYRVFAHNDAARQFLDRSGWTKMTEQQFVLNLYRLRGRHAPDLAAYGVSFSAAEWPEDEPSTGIQQPEAWPHQHMSARRRNFEPLGQTRMTWRNPCLDVDLAVVDRDDQVALVVDYKAPGAKINLTSTNMQALSQLHTRRSHRDPTMVAAMLVSYQPTKPQWQVRVHCLNQSARLHLAYVLGGEGTTEQLADTIAGAEWTDLSEAQWRSVLDAARDL